MERLRPVLLAARLDQALLAPCAVLVGIAYARYDARLGSGLLPVLIVLAAALFAGAGVSLVDHAWDRWGAPAGEDEPPLDARDAAIVGSLLLLAALLLAACLAPISGAAAIGYGAAAVVLGVVRGAPVAGLDTLGRGVGDLANALALGPLASLSGFAAVCGEGSIGAFAAGLPGGLAAAGALYVRHFTRPDADLRHDRLTPVAMLGEATARQGLVAFPVLAILALFLIVQAGEAPRGVYAAAIPMAAAAFLGWRAARGPAEAPAAFGTTACVAAAAVLLTLAAAFRLAVR